MKKTTEFITYFTFILNLLIFEQKILTDAVLYTLEQKKISLKLQVKEKKCLWIRYMPQPIKCICASNTAAFYCFLLIGRLELYLLPFLNHLWLSNICCAISFWGGGECCFWEIYIIQLLFFSLSFKWTIMSGQIR